MPLPTPKSGESRNEFISRCMGDETMKSEYPRNDQRLAVCSSQWDQQRNASASNVVRKPVEVVTRIQAEHTKKKRFMGTEYLVFPVVALVQGVVRPGNSDQPELALAEEFGRIPMSWNGRPIVLGHPKIQGIPVPANDPMILNEWSMGMMFHTERVLDKLVSEMWINEARAEQIEATERLQALKDGEVIEVSTGLFMRLEPISGRYNGRKFEGIWRDVVPDHLAILREGEVGACSVSDGCGANRFNSASSNPFYEYEACCSSCAEGSGSCACGDAAGDNPDQGFHLVFDEQEGTPQEGVGAHQRANDSNSSGGNAAMKELIDKLIANEATQFTETDRDWLGKMEEAQLKKLEPTLNERTVEKEVEKEVTPDISLQNLEKYLPKEDMSRVNSALEMYENRRKELVEELKNNERCEFTEEELNGFDLNNLQRLSKLAGPKDDDKGGQGGQNRQNQGGQGGQGGQGDDQRNNYGGRANPDDPNNQGNHQQRDNEAAPEPPQIFPLKSGANGE